MNTTTTSVLYRSYLHLNTENDDVRDALTDSHRLHQLLSRAHAHAMTDGHTRARADIGLLYSVDANRTDGTSRLICQSTIHPDWTAIDAALQTQPHEYVDQTPLEHGETVRVQIDADPTKSIPSPINPLRPDAPRSRGRKTRIDDPEKRLEWATRKLTDAGLNIDTIADNGTIRSDSRTKGFRLGLTRFTAIATVNDPCTLRQAQIDGIGRSRTYGAGLLLLRP